MSNRYYARYAGKTEGFLELYEVVDSTTREAVSAKLPYHVANSEADARNQGKDVSQHLTANGLGAWMAILPYAPAAVTNAIVQKLIDNIEGDTP